MKQTITRNDGITYERRTRKVQYDTKTNIRLSSEELQRLKDYAARENVKYTSLMREIIEDFIERECK